jgi:hypothetical protein
VVWLSVGTAIVLVTVKFSWFEEDNKIVEVANALDISYKTVANTTSLLKQKLGAKNHSDLIRIAVEIRLG